ncbi:hypothetical protein IWQ60_009566 [Tieghemiomyces parasiticus]|uniref:RNA polymerase II subunit B1 CTD phosphatase RPAP2 homolog n=1 Tax=Tieghemiomyces parasiticus TaxID=78921 RepID=A0A9W8DPD1_9FUNG|nr:hypothetical protein IWQ60_009566 [Tieghemiomyces parasiticus]
MSNPAVRPAIRPPGPTPSPTGRATASLVQADATRAPQAHQRHRRALTPKQKAVKEKLTLQRRYETLTFRWQEKLFRVDETSATVAEATLIQAAHYLTPQTFDEVIEERKAQNVCGYPLCGKPCMNIPGQYRINLQQRKVYDVSELNRFCSKVCRAASKFYETQLSTDPLYIRSRNRLADLRKSTPQVTPAGNLFRDYVRALLDSLPSPIPPPAGPPATTPQGGKASLGAATTTTTNHPSAGLAQIKLVIKENPHPKADREAVTSSTSPVAIIDVASSTSSPSSLPAPGPIIAKETDPPFENLGPAARPLPHEPGGAAAISDDELARTFAMAFPPSDGAKLLATQQAEPVPPPRSPPVSALPSKDVTRPQSGKTVRFNLTPDTDAAATHPSPKNSDSSVERTITEDAGQTNFDFVEGYKISPAVGRTTRKPVRPTTMVLSKPNSGDL